MPVTSLKTHDPEKCGYSEGEGNQTMKKRPNAITIDVSTATHEKLRGTKAELELLLRKPVSLNDVIAIFYITVPIDTALAGYMLSPENESGGNGKSEP